jgi:multicomponent K+:H+ antiporter subunit A
MTWDGSLPLLTLLTSLISAAVVFALPEARERTRTVVNMAAATGKLLLVAVMLWGVFHAHQYECRWPVLAGVDLILRADALAMFFVTLSAVLWFLTTLYAIAYLEGSPHRRRFFGFFSLCVSATVGIALAGNLFTFVIFYELLTLATYPLVVHRETRRSRRAGRIYLIYTFVGGVLLLTGAVWLYALVPTVDFNDGASLASLGDEHTSTLRIVFVLLIGGLGVKAALVPLHGWLPEAMVAPAPVSALLHAVAVVKAGAFGIVRVVYDVYGIDRAYALGLLTPLAVWASVTILYGSLRALFQDDLKRRLAFSTVSQVSYIALGVSIFGPSSTVGGVAHLVHQGLMKITLFFCAGTLAETLGIHKISHMHGVGRRMPWTMAAFTIGALGMIGVPPVVGFLSKWYLGTGALEASQPWVLIVLAASSALNAAYFLPILGIAWFGEPRGDGNTDQPPRGREAKWGLLVPPLVTATLALGCGVLAGAPFIPLQWAALIADRAYGRAVIVQGLSNDAVSLTLDHGLLLLALATPLIIACLLLSYRLRRVALSLAALAALPAVVLALAVAPGAQVDLPWLLLHMRLGVDTTGQMFLLFTALLWLLAGVYARGYLADDPRAPRFFFYFLLTLTGNLGLVLAQDMASFYLFFAVMSLASYPLVVHDGDPASMFAGRVYLILVVVGEVALLAGILLATEARGTLLFDQGEAVWSPSFLRHAMFGLLWFGFGIKAGVVPLHVWLPLAHPAAPTPASAVLSGAMIKAGLLGWMRFLPVGTATSLEWGQTCLIVGFVTVFFGVAVGVTQRNAKAVLAYSSVSQMGLLAIGLGGGLLVPAAWPAISAAMLIYALHHGLSKGCLFLSVGVAPGWAGSWWQQKWLRVGLVLPALSLAGAPLTIGAVGKSSLKYSLAVLPDPWMTLLDVVLPLAAVGTTLLMARFLYLIWPATPSPAKRPARTVLGAWCALLLLVLCAVWLIPTTADFKTGARLLLETITYTNVWPVGLASLLAWSGWRACGKRGVLQRLAIPAGDLLRLSHVFQQPLQAPVRSWSRRLRHGQRIGAFRTQAAAAGQRMRQFVQFGEAAMTRWPAIALSLLIVLGMSLLCQIFLRF